MSDFAQCTEIALDWSLERDRVSSERGYEQAELPAFARHRLPDHFGGCGLGLEKAIVPRLARR